MQIAQNTVVTIDYTLKDDKGTVLDSSEGGEALAYLHGAGNIIPGLESALEGKIAGDSLAVTVAPEEAYGSRNLELIHTVPRSMFPEEENIMVGAQYHAQGPEGEMISFMVTAAEGDSVTVDANHPLAGEQLHFDVQIVDVRAASDEEISHGHAHGEGGHHHHD
jgi:FKBP-type peptidyl-prolyl cis-trans isomerase SlyD